jgi:hypothetical protein
VANGADHAAVVLPDVDGRPDDDIDDSLERTSEP